MRKHSPLIVVTGGNGYLGSVLVPMLVTCGYRVRVIDQSQNSSNTETIQTDVRTYPKELLKGAEAVIDLAAIANETICEQNPRLTREINVLARARTAALAKSMGVKRYILASSCSVYGKQSGLLTESTKPDPATIYARSNVEAEHAVLGVSSNDFCVTVFRLGSLVGLAPRMRYDTLLNRMVRSLVETGSITINDGLQWRPILHVSDAAAAFILALRASKAKVSGHIFNVCATGQNMQIHSLAKHMFSAVSLPPKIIVNKHRDNRSYKVSGRKIKNTLHFSAHKLLQNTVTEIFRALIDPKTYTAKRLTQCLICNGTMLVPYISLGPVALANAYIDKAHLLRAEPRYPLTTVYCRTCHHSQLALAINPKILFESYAYSSSTSPQLLPYFNAYAKDLVKTFPTQAKHVLEIGSNDGLLLGYLKERGANVLGVDPAQNIVKTAQLAGLPTINKFFTLGLARQIKKDHRNIGIVIANHVLAHTPDPHDMIAGIKHVLSENGVFVCEVKYLMNLIEDNAFDTIYHEHVSYFLLKPLQALLRMHDLDIFDVKYSAHEGGSLKIFASHTPLRFPVNAAIGAYLKKEERHHLYIPKTYADFAKKPLRTKKQLMTLLRTLKKSGKRVAAYGASAKGGTLLQYCGIDSSLVDFVVDAAPSKIGKYMPGTHIPIMPPATLKKNVPDYILLLAWNYSESIMKREHWFTRRGGKFIIPIPLLKIV